MLFEGSEKKVEVVVNHTFPSLRSLGQDFWAGVVSKANATLLSFMSNASCDAYLLSESSLFVWDHRFLMLTCGITTLVDATIHVLEQIPDQAIAFACYQRKNEYLPHLQKSTFEQDLRRLRQHLSGQALRLGNLDSHHCYIFHTHKRYEAPPNDCTSELLMYHIQGDVAEYLLGPHQTRDEIRQHLQLDQLLPGFQLDDYVFAPFGYSLNALNDSHYATIHITPQSDISYVSFETNQPPAEWHHALCRWLDILQPGSWDILGFNSKPIIPHVPNVFRIGAKELSLSCGYHVFFHHYQRGEQCKIRNYDETFLHEHE